MWPIIVSVVAALSYASIVGAQEQDPLLRGPDVERDGRTIVQFDFSGALRVLETRPEIAAAALLPLAPERREQIRTINERRETELGKLLVEHIDTVVEITDAIRAGDSRTAQQLVRFLHEQFNPQHDRDPLLTDYAAVLTDDELAEAQRMVDEYWEVWIDRSMQGAEEGGEDARRATRQRLAFELFQQELRAAYDWSLRPYREKLERIAEIVGPTAEQQTAIRKAVIDHIREAGLEPTDEQRRALARQVYDILDEQRRRELFEYVWWRL